MLRKACPWDPHPWKGEEGSRKREKLRYSVGPTTGLAEPTGSSRVGMVFRIVLSWGDTIMPSYSRIQLVIGWGPPGKRCELGQGS